MESSHLNAQAFSNTVNFFCSPFNSFHEAETLQTQRKTSVTFILFSNTFLLSSFGCYTRIMWLIFQLIDFIFIGSMLLFSPPLNLVLYFSKIPKGLLFTAKFLLEEYPTKSLSGYQLYSFMFPVLTWHLWRLVLFIELIWFFLEQHFSTLFLSSSVFQSSSYKYFRLSHIRFRIVQFYWVLP